VGHDRRSLPDRARPLFDDWLESPGGRGKIKGACTHTIWNFYEAPRPWGPGTEIGKHDSFPPGYYSPEICPRLQSANRVYIFTAGNWSNRDIYRLTIVPLERVVRDCEV